MSCSPSIIRSLIVTAILVCAACAGSTPPLADARLTTEGRRWTHAFYDGKTQDMWDHMSPSLQRLVGDKAGLDAFREKVLADGGESAVLEESIEPVNGAESYIRVARFREATFPARIAIAVDPKGTIVLFSVRSTFRGSFAAPLPSEGS
jgi:hypothetical protein